ncbi:MAG: shikimate kinase [Cyanobacteria bacterium J06607_10]
MPSDIVLIGPIGAGKSTIGKLLSQRLGLPQCSMDERRWDYYKEIGYDDAIAQQKRAEGAWSLNQYWNPFEAHAVERLLATLQNCVIDFGAGHSVYEDAALFKRVSQALEPYPNVVLIMPSADLDESLEILNERNQDLPEDISGMNAFFVRHTSNYLLAKLTVYTKNKTPTETCEEILESLDLL